MNRTSSAQLWPRAKASFRGRTPDRAPPSDPAPRWTAAKAGPAFFAYLTNYLIDLDHASERELSAVSRLKLSHRAGGG